MPTAAIRALWLEPVGSLISSDHPPVRWTVLSGVTPVPLTDRKSPPPFWETAPDSNPVTLVGDGVSHATPPVMRDRRTDVEAVDRDGRRVAGVAVALPPHAELGACVGGIEVARLVLVGHGRAERHRRMGGEGAAHQEEDGDEGKDDGQRLPTLIAMDPPGRSRNGVAPPDLARHHHCLGAARRVWVTVSPLTPASARVITIV